MVPGAAPDAAGSPAGEQAAAVGGQDVDGGGQAVAAGSVFGDRLELAVRYARLLATDGVVRGLIGPRETDRLWDRHLLNCAVLGELIADGAYVLDVGSGAGLPGIVLAIARPDLTVVLIEPLARRTAFLTEAVRELGLGARVEVLRGRAEEVVSGPLAGRVKPADVVTARAVAPIDRLAGWCLPLARVGGRVLALKGSTAADEVAIHGAVVERLGGGTPRLLRCGVGVLDQPATVVEIVRERIVDDRSTSGRTAAGRSSPRSSSVASGSGRSRPRRSGSGRSGSDRRGR
jgi:16S rRNA (guanine527-N7)-methyltransferase